MEDCTGNKRKLVQDDYYCTAGGADSSESSSVRVDSEGCEANSPESKRVRLNPGDDSSEFDDPVSSPEAKRIQDDLLLSILDDSDAVAIQGLDSVIKSFEEEMLVPAPVPAVLDATSDPGESQPDLGYLLEASDDELGLPPTISAAEEPKIEAVEFESSSSDGVGLYGMLGFQNELLSYDSFELGLAVYSDGNINDENNEFVTLGGLFDYSDQSFEPAAENSEFLWRQESLPAL